MFTFYTYAPGATYSRTVKTPIRSAYNMITGMPPKKEGGGRMQQYNRKDQRQTHQT